MAADMMSMVVILMVVEVILLFSQLVLELLVILGCSDLGDHPLHWRNCKCFWFWATLRETGYIQQLTPVTTKLMVKPIVADHFARSSARWCQHSEPDAGTRFPERSSRSGTSCCTPPSCLPARLSEIMSSSCTWWDLTRPAQLFHICRRDRLSHCLLEWWLKNSCFRLTATWRRV